MALPDPRVLDRDDAVAELDAASRRLVATTCERRAELELHGAAAFTAITQALVGLRADTRIVELSSRAIDDERRHSEIYLSLARAYSLDGVPARRPSTIEIPRFAGAGDDGERLLQVVGMCCINETMACSFLELCLSGATASRARAGIREVLEDEIRHARIGWAYLGSSDVGLAERRLVSVWLAPMLHAQWGLWREQIGTLPAVDIAEHGCPAPAAIEGAAVASMRDLVVPGFAHAGLDVSEALRWIASGRPVG